MRRGALMGMRTGALIAPCLDFDKAVAPGRLILGETALLIFVAAAAVAGIIASGLWGGIGHGGRHRRGGEDASVVSRPVGRRHIPSAVARLRCRSGRRGARRAMRALWRRAAFRLLSAQAAGPALPARV